MSLQQRFGYIHCQPFANTSCCCLHGVSQVYGPGGKWLKQPDLIFQKYQADAHVFTTDTPLSVVTQVGGEGGV